MNQDRIQGGFILMARKLLKSGIMEKPALYIKLWLWMLLQASHTDHRDLNRGQFFTSLSRIRKAMAYKVGFRVEYPSVKEIRSAMKVLMKDHMIGTMKVTHGMVITILNYDLYQNPENYEGHDEGHGKGHTEGTIPTRRDKEGNIYTPEKISGELSSLLERYDDGRLIDQALQAIARTRKGSRIADTVKLSILRKWEQYPIEQVEAGVRIYLEKRYAEQGKREAYLLAIIRNQRIGEGPMKSSTGSSVLDKYYAHQRLGN